MIEDTIKVVGESIAVTIGVILAIKIYGRVKYQQGYMDGMEDRSNP